MSAVRVLSGLGRISSLDQDELNTRVLDVQPNTSEVGPAFHRVYGSSKRQAGSYGATGNPSTTTASSSSTSRSGRAPSGGR